MAAIMASIDHSVEELRAGKITAFEFRRLADARRKSEHEAWQPIRHAARMRGAW